MASTICWAVHAAWGCVVTLTCSTRRRSAAASPTTSPSTTPPWAVSGRAELAALMAIDIAELAEAFKRLAWAVERGGEA